MRAKEAIDRLDPDIVSHAYNMVRIDERYRRVKKAYEHYAPRYDGDDEFDVRTLFAKMAGSNG